jgi:membrane protein
MGSGELHGGCSKSSRSDPQSTVDRETVTNWQRRYQGSLVQDLSKGLSTVQFGDQIVLFGASLLLSVLPLIILLSALASSRVDDDISARLGLNREGAHVLDSLFTHSRAAFSLGILVSLLLAVAGTLMVARSLQTLYQRIFEQEAHRGWSNVLRCAVWVLVTAGMFFLDTVTSRPIRDLPAGRIFLGLANIAMLTVFFWWSIHFLLGGREPWRRVFPAALATGVFWVGLGAFASLYFSSTIVSDSHLYGAIGVVFTLVTWFIAMGAVVTLGAVTGHVWLSRRSHRGRVAPQKPGQ